MAAGGGAASLIPAAMTLLGIVTILRARRARKKGRRQADDKGDDVRAADSAEARRAATIETERRMAAYLASRDRS